MKTRTAGKTRAPKAERQYLIKPVIDYPKDTELLETGRYTLRVSAPGALAVSIAVDQGEWREARPSVGYWWFDWSPETAGEHELIACAAYEDGRELVSQAVHCFSQGS
jgi:hypothetical protein